MNQTKVLKFGTMDTVRFLKIYRSFECLWDTENVDYKNRSARHTALRAFVKKFGVKDYGPTDVTNKIKNLRTQYQAEKKKIRDSMAGSDDEVYTPKLPWFNLMKNILEKTPEDEETSVISDDLPERESETGSSVAIKYEDDNFVDIDSLDNTIQTTETDWSWSHNTTLKFSAADTIRFLKIYRSFDCLWDTENINYKNRKARHMALRDFAKKFGVNGYGPHDVSNKIKILRTQYQAERKKIMESMSGSDDNEVYKTKLPWFYFMEAILEKKPEEDTSVILENLPETEKNSSANLKYEDDNFVDFDSMDNTIQTTESESSMNQNMTLKFSAADTIRFLKIYRSFECLWDTENINYKNRKARHMALRAFAKKFGVEGYGPNDVTAKIRNLRTQYTAERRKIRESMNGSDNTELYKPRLPWFNFMKAILEKKPVDEENTYLLDNATELKIDTGSRVVFKYEDDNFVDIDSLDNTIQTPEPEPQYPKKTRRKRSSSDLSADSGSERLDNRVKRAKLNTEDDLDCFGKYVTSSLRILNMKNCIRAQDEIQAVLSKYKLKNAEDNERRNHN